MLIRLARLSAFATWVILLLAGGCQSNGGGHSSDAGMAPANAEQEVIAVIEQYRQALMKKDLAALDRIWADDLTFINMRGELLGKQQRMENVRSGATGVNSTKVSDQQVRVYGQTAVVTTRETIEAQYSGQQANASYRFTSVWVRRNGSWQVVAVHMTRVDQ